MLSWRVFVEYLFVDGIKLETVFVFARRHIAMPFVYLVQLDGAIVANLFGLILASVRLMCTVVTRWEWRTTSRWTMKRTRCSSTWRRKTSVLENSASPHASRRETSGHGLARTGGRARAGGRAGGWAGGRAGGRTGGRADGRAGGRAVGRAGRLGGLRGRRAGGANDLWAKIKGLCTFLRYGKRGARVMACTWMIADLLCI